MRIDRVETACVSLPLDRPVITPIHHITHIDCVLTTVHTDEGLHGISYLWTFGPARARVLEAMVRDLGGLVRGDDPMATEAAWRRMWHDTNFLGHAGVSMLGMAAIDTALWDIKGKALNQPLYRLLGGAKRAMPVYAGGLFLSDSIDMIVAEAKGYIAQGFRAMKMRTGAKSAGEDIARVEAVRAAIGPEARLMVDVVQGWAPDQAIRMGRELARFDLTWIEDPVLFDDLEGMARVAAALDTPIACGENDYSKHGFARLIEMKAADFPMPDLQRVGGVSEWMKVAAMADAARLPVVPHVFHEISVHMMAAAPNGGFMEYVPWWDRLFRETIPIIAGTATPTDRPGLGLEFNWDALEPLRVKS